MPVFTVNLLLVLAALINAGVSFISRHDANQRGTVKAVAGILANGATGYYMGIWDDGTSAYGTLVATNKLGFENTTFFDPFGNVGGFFGTARDTFGVTATSGATVLTGHVDPSEDGVVNITSGTAKFSGSVNAPQTVTIYLMNGAAQVLQVNQVFSFPFVGNPNILKNTVTLTNLTAGMLSSIKVRKITTYTQVDTSTSQPNTLATIPMPGFAIGGGIVCSATNPYSFGPFPDIQHADPTIPFHTAGGSNPATTPGTYAASWDLSIPNLPPGGTATFSVYFSVFKSGQALADVIADLVALGLTNYFTGTNASTSYNTTQAATVPAGGLTGAVAFGADSGGGGGSPIGYWRPKWLGGPRPWPNFRLPRTRGTSSRGRTRNA